ALIEFFQKIPQRDQYKPIEPAKPAENYPLSSSQKRLYLLHRMNPAGTEYNMPYLLPLDDDADKEKLEEIVKQIVRRHEAFRTSFIEERDVPVQKIHPQVDITLQYVETMNTISELSELVRPFELNRPPLLRVAVVKTREYGQLMMIDMHHIISDGQSQQMLTREFMTMREGGTLPRVKLHYKDYSQWRNSEEIKKEIKQQEAFWLKEFAEEVPMLNLPLDYPRPALQSFEGNKCTTLLKEQYAGALKKMALEKGVTYFTLLLAINNILLARLTGQEDVVMGTPVAGREHPDLENIIGVFINTIALRNYPAGEKTVSGYLKEVGTRALAAFDNQAYPFEDLVEKTTVERDLSRNPLFDVLFLQQDAAAEKNQFASQRKVPADIFSYQSAKFDLTINMFGKKEGLEIAIEYCTRLFKQETVQRFLNFLKRIIHAVIKTPNKKISEIEIISEEDKRRVIYEFNDTRADYPGEKSIHQLFEEQAGRTPDRISLVGIPYPIHTTGSKNETCCALSFAELNGRTQYIANLLKEKGVGPDAIVGLKVERSLEMILGVLAILKAGGAYLPIDPGNPEDRIRFILKDSSAVLLLTVQSPAEKKRYHKDTLYLDQLQKEEPGDISGTSTAAPAKLAYIIYTSGSTGTPKGVMIDHYSVINRLNWMQRYYPLSGSDVILQKTTYTFDVSVWELLWWTQVGASVFLLEIDGEKNPGAIVGAIEKHNVTTMHFVPSMLQAFLEYLEIPGEVGRLSGLRRVFASGEALTPHQVAAFGRLFSGVVARLINLYGPTEATVDVSYFNINPGREYKNIPIGKPIDNIRLYV
ncbi:MAG: AMP-binding protein, partial [bacterium]|nr:AMP-binding protein [bacterium]